MTNRPGLLAHGGSPARIIALGATLGTLAALSRLPFAPFPGVQPASALVLLAGMALGGRVGLTAGLVVPLVSNAFLGHGPWTPFQMLGWGMIGLVGGALPRATPRWALAIVGLLAGLAYGVLLDGWVWLASVRPLALHTLLPVMVRGLPFNLAHGIGNAVILWVVGPRLARLLHRAKVKRDVVALEPAGSRSTR